MAASCPHWSEIKLGLRAKQVLETDSDNGCVRAQCDGQVRGREMPPAGHVCQRPLTDDVRVFLKITLIKALMPTLFAPAHRLGSSSS